ncbi:MAG: MjaI family restriction endonuclease [Flavobacteriaceae bacterium]
MKAQFIRSTLIKNPEITLELGERLYEKITEVIQSEVNEISEEDCVNYMLQLVIERTFDGYMTEINTVYGQLQKILGIKIEAAPDEWDRLFNVDFFIQVEEKFIGLQIKPVNIGMQLPEIFKEYSIQAKTHEKFTKKFGGKVFYLFSTKVGDKKVIANPETIDEIKTEIKRLKKQ